MASEDRPFMMSKTAAESSLELPHKSPRSEGLDRSWHPGAVKHFPMAGFAALATVVVCCGASIGILVASNGAPIGSWSLTPSVWLAITNAVAIATLTFAFSEGVVIAWWRRTLKGGTVADLHENWSFGHSAFKSVISGRKFNLVAAASLTTVIVFVAGPLLQRASHTATSTISASRSISAALSSVLPYGYSGIIGGRGGELGWISLPVIDVLSDYTNRVPIKAGFAGCNGTCSGRIEAAGIAVNCTTSTYAIDYNAPLLQYSLDGNASGLAVEQLTFATNFTWQPKYLLKPAQINMLAAYRSKSDVNCSGEVTVKKCTLRSSTVNYEFQIDEGVTTLSDDLSTYTSGAIQNVSHALNTNDPTDYSTASQRTTIGGLSWIATNSFQSNASYSFRGAVGWQLRQSGILVQQYISSDILNKYNRDACNATWKDPTDKILLSLHEFMFRTAIKSANTSTFETVLKATPEQLVVPGPRQIPVIQTSTVQVYKTEFRYLAGALVIYVIAFLFVTATFWGFWELGRKFSMSPIETAKAFDAPALQGAGTNLPVDELLAVYKKTPLKYGVVSGPDGTNKLTLGTSEIEKPVVGSTFH